MGDKEKYDLVHLDQTCVLTGQSNNILLNSPDLTSIIDALNNNKNPSTLFTNQSKDVRNNAISEQLNYVHETLENIRIWFDRTLIPSLQVMSSEDFQKCVPLLNLIDVKVQHIKSSSKKKSTAKKELIQRSYGTSCPVCDKFYFLKNSNDWLEYENHDHIAELLSSGAMFNTDCAENIEEARTCNEINTQPKAKDETNNSQKTNVNKPLLPSLYTAKVRDVLYPAKLASNICSIENNYKYYTVQAVSTNKFNCFLCRIDMYEINSVFSHAGGQKHKSKLRNRHFTSAVLSYHLIFSHLPEEMQKHQVVFKPSFKLKFIFCQVCALQVPNEDVVHHINTHMHRVRLDTQRFRKLNFFDDILKSIRVDSSSEEDSSDVSLATKLIYNSSNNELKRLISQVKSLKVAEDRTDSQKESESTDEESEDESESSKSGAVENETNEPRQGTSKMTPESPPNQVSNSKESKTPKSNGTAERTVVLKHNILPAFKEKVKDLFDELENRYQVYVDYLKTTDMGPQCIICMKNLPYDMNEIKIHLASNEHKKNAGTQFGKQKYTYYCDLCYKYCQSETKWSDHLLCIEHRQRVEAILKGREPRGGPFKEYECSTCYVVLFGNNGTINKHLKENAGAYKKSRKKKEVVLPPQLIQLLRSEQLFAGELHKLAKESHEVLKLIDLSWECCKGIEKALEPIFGQCKAYPFGSRVSGLGNLGSDLDVFVDTGMMYEGMFNQDSESQAKLVSQTARALKKHKDFSDVFAIPYARTPIVQVFHNVTELDCDLSFRHGLSVQNTEFLRLCIDVQPALKLVILFLKRWSFLCKLNDRITTYALSMLCVFYFQRQGFLPSVKALREIDPTESRIIAGWETFRFMKPLTELKLRYPPCIIPPRHILISIFEFYMNFKFNMEVICPLLGCTVLKSSFYQDKGRGLPSEMKAYVSRINENDENEVFRSMSPMCIQDPFDLSHNLTKACPVDLVNKFVTLCQLSHAAMCKKY